MTAQPRQGLTVHIIDDDAGMRNSLVMLMQSASLSPQSYENAEQFLEQARLDHPGCIVLDLRMPGMGGMQLLQKLKEFNIAWPVIVISGHATVTTAVRSMKLGAVDVLQKPFEPQALLEVVQRVLATVGESHAQRLEQEAIRRKIATLTPRELELLQMIVSGQSNKQVAAALRISIKTVANHRASIMAKIGAANAPDLARMSMIAGLATSGGKR